MMDGFSYTSKLGNRISINDAGSIDITPNKKSTFTCSVDDLVDILNNLEILYKFRERYGNVI